MELVILKSIFLKIELLVIVRMQLLLALRILILDHESDITTMPGYYNSCGQPVLNTQK